MTQLIDCDSKKVVAGENGEAAKLSAVVDGGEVAVCAFKHQTDGDAYLPDIY